MIWTLLWNLHIPRFKFKFYWCSKIISIEKNRNPNNGFITLNENYIDFLKIIIEEDKEYYEKNRVNKNIRLNHLKKNNDKSPYHLLIQSEITCMAFTRIKFNQYFLAAYELQKAYSYLKKRTTFPRIYFK